MEIITRPAKLVWYCYHDYWIEHEDPRTKSYPLLQGGPEPVVAIVAAYLLFVKVIGPKIMENRRPFVLRTPMLVYNLFMVLVNMFFFLCVLVRIDYGRRFLNFKFPSSDDTSPITLLEIQIGYLCYLTRFLDLMDTVFFVLRKKNNQITFLHIYHHTLVPIIGYMCMKIAPQAPVLGLFLMFNTLIHSVMYLYYALAAFGPEIQKYLWWKKYITQLQLLQFGSCFVYAVIMVFLQEGFPAGLFWLGFAQNPFFFYMFYDFYKKAYHKPTHPRQPSKALADDKKSE